MRHTRLRRLVAVEWDTLAGIVAAFLAMLLSFFGLVSEVTVQAILLLLAALILLRELRIDTRAATHAEHLDCMRQDIRDIREKVGTTDLIVITPLALRPEFEDFATHLTGRVTWYNACCRMFHRQEIFEGTLGRLIANPDITAIEMLCDDCERHAWESDVAIQVQHHGGAEKVREPVWVHVPPTISFLVGEHREYRRPLALMAIMEEPFASHGNGLAVPRYLFRIQNHSDILTAMAELARSTASGCTKGRQVPDGLAHDVRSELGRGWESPGGVEQRFHAADSRCDLVRTAPAEACGDVCAPRRDGGRIARRGSGGALRVRRFRGRFGRGGCDRPGAAGDPCAAGWRPGSRLAVLVVSPDRRTGQRRGCHAGGARERPARQEQRSRHGQAARVELGVAGKSRVLGRWRDVAADGFGGEDRRSGVVPGGRSWRPAVGGVGAAIHAARV